MRQTKAVEAWTLDPLDQFVSESGAQLTLLMTPAGQVLAQHGFTRAVDVMSAAALGAAIVASSTEIARLLDEPGFATLNHQGVQHGIFLGDFESPRGRLLVLVVYGPDSSVGLVQLFFDELVEGLVAAAPVEERPQAVLAANFEDELNRSLASLFEITCKIVYYGPGRSGKTTNLQYIYGRVPEQRRGRMVSLATQTDRTLFFDFLPLELGSISGFTTRFQLYTVPGQVYYNATRKLVLQGADGVVFVADSQARQLDENIESLQNLQANLVEQGVDARGVPLVIQYNKQDLPSDLILSTQELDEALNFWNLPSFAAAALQGTGVFETLKAASEMVLRKLSQEEPV